MDTTNEFSFILKPSQYGIGVFATHNIKKGTWLRLFGDMGERSAVTRRKGEVPRVFFDLCIEGNDTLLCPEDFSRMHIGWHLNHSLNPNATHENPEWYATRDIAAGEEILINLQYTWGAGRGEGSVLQKVRGNDLF